MFESDSTAGPTIPIPRRRKTSRGARSARVEPAESSERTDRNVTALIFASAFGIYVAFLTTHHSFDAVAGGVLLLQWIANGAARHLFHPYHILYLPLAVAADSLLSRVGLVVDPLTLLQLINTLFAAGAVALFYRIARRLGLGNVTALPLVALFGLGHCSWYYASNAEPYPVSIFFLLLAFLSALRLPPEASLARVVRPGLWLGLAAGFHITCALAAPALALAVWTGAREKRLQRSVALLATAGLVAVAPYAFVYAYHDRTDPVSGLLAELRATADPGYRDTVWWSIEPTNLVREWRGLGEAMAPIAQEDAPAKIPALSRALQIGLLTLALLPLSLAFTRRERSGTTWMLATWFLATFVFFSTYNVASEKFAAYQWAPLLLLIGVALRALERTRLAHRALCALTLLLAVGTTVASLDVVRRQTDPSTNPHLRRAQAIARNTGKDDLVIHLGRGENTYQKVYTPYFAVRRSLVLDFCFNKTRQSSAETLGMLAGRIAEQLELGRRVFILGDAAEETASRREFERIHELAPGTLARFFARFEPRVVTRDPDLGDLWSLGEEQLASVRRTDEG
jgi:hypothetical protein